MTRTRAVLAVSSIVILAACSQPGALQPPASAPVALEKPNGIGPDAARFRAIYSFGKGSQDGQAPQSSPIAVKGVLYGTTSNGGAMGLGTIFSMTPAGRETIRHFFAQDDGVQPVGNLIESNGDLYGTAYTGGTLGGGTVFRLAMDGTFTVLHDFDDGTDDGGLPEGGVVAINKTFYGTTEGGGASNGGMVYSVTNSGHERVLHSFTGTDGSDSDSSLIASNGALYGTTIGGGRV